MQTFLNMTVFRTLIVSQKSNNNKKKTFTTLKNKTSSIKKCPAATSLIKIKISKLYKIPFSDLLRAQKLYFFCMCSSW